jgi:ribonuclease Z
MTPTFHPRLVNGRFGDPALFVEILHRREALLFDMGDLSALSTRDLLRVSHVFVTHMHMDHFIGFDRLLRVNIGRQKVIRIVGPEGVCERIHHKLQGYDWDLAERYEAELVFVVTALSESGLPRGARFRFKRRFAWEVPVPLPALGAEGFEVHTAFLEHHGICLGYALTEPAHANVWRNRLDDLDIGPGPWLQRLKKAILAGAGDETLIGLPDGRHLPLGELRGLVSIGPGQKVAYVTDVADTAANREAIAELASGADLLFIESRFAAADSDQAKQRAHLTTKAAGEIARAAEARRVEPFHFSPRYEGGGEMMIGEVMSAFEGQRCEQAGKEAPAPAGAGAKV